MLVGMFSFLAEHACWGLSIIYGRLDTKMSM